MAEPTDKPPFQLQVGYDQEELLGARWWHEGMRMSFAPIRHSTGAASVDESRRSALRTLAMVGGGVVLFGALAVRCNSDSSSGSTVVEHDSLALQRTNGLAWKADNVPFAWGNDVIATTDDGKPFDASWLPTLAKDLEPTDTRWLPFYVPTLFQAPTANGSAALASGFRMVRSTAMQRAFARGQAVRELLDHAEQAQRWLLIVDLPGPESVAFAAALRPTANVVVAFDNLPHPKGVVPAHLTLGAAMHYRARFLAAPGAAAANEGARPTALVLDRDRLAEYRNTLGEVIPRNIITRAPSAELKPGQTDQDTLPPYAVLDSIIEAYMERDESPRQIIARGCPEADVRKVVGMLKKNEYKRRQAPVGIRVTQRGFGKDWRYPITSRYPDEY